MPMVGVQLSREQEKCGEEQIILYPCSCSIEREREALERDREREALERERC